MNIYHIMCLFNVMLLICYIYLYIIYLDMIVLFIVLAYLVLFIYSTFSSKNIGNFGNLRLEAIVKLT